MLQQLSQWSSRYYSTLLIVILTFSFVTRMWNLTNPQGYMFDEVYHAVTAKLIARDDPRAYEWWNQPVEPNTAVDWLHPPLAKYTQALSMRIFGENALGWRFSSVVFGVLVILMTAQLARTVTGDERVALLAALLAASDGLLLVQSRIAMNDIHVTFAILLTLTWYARSHPLLHSNRTGQTNQVSTESILLTGLLAGIAMATKWSGLFALVVVLVFEVLSIGRGAEWKNSGYWLSWLGSRVLCLVLLPLVVYVASYGQMFAQGKDMQHFYDLHKQIYWYQTGLKAEHPYQSRPWQWVTDLRPVWYHVEYGEGQRGDVYAFGNPVVFWAGALAVLVAGFGLVQQLLDKLNQQSITAVRLAQAVQTVALQPIALLFASYFAVWLPWQFSPRIMFFYHYAPAVPLMTILLSWLMIKHKELKNLWVGVVLLSVAAFVIWYPHWTGMQMRSEFKDAVYFVTERWK